MIRAACYLDGCQEQLTLNVLVVVVVAVTMAVKWLYSGILNRFVIYSDIFSYLILQHHLTNATHARYRMFKETYSQKRDQIS